MSRARTAAFLADRLTRPLHVGIYGHQGVGKTTLLTMLYREGVAGRLPGLRLAAGDARTASYLAERVLQLEAGQRLPGTLAETALRLQLYQGDTRLELIVKDYQGEHIALGRQEPIRDFFRDCDAVLLCVDAAALADPAQRLERQQEVEQLIEEYLADEPLRTMDRPVALVLTRADLLPGPGEPPAESLGLIRHALRTHCPRSAAFAVHCLEEKNGDAGLSTFTLNPLGLAEPLTWLVEALQAQDEARMQQLWSLAPADVRLLRPSVASYAHRYPSAPATAGHQRRLREVARQRRRRWTATAAAALAGLITGLWAYDVWGFHQTRRFETERPGEPEVVLQRWQDYQLWHPTRHLLRATSPEAEEQHLRGLEFQARLVQRDRRLAELNRLAAISDADPDELWQMWQMFVRADYPDTDLSPEALSQLRAIIQLRRDEQRARQAQRAFDELVSAEAASARPEDLLARADRILREHPGSGVEAEVRRRRAVCLLRLDEQAIQPARTYSAQHPFNFQTRREHYQRYLDQHPSGAFSSEAEAALADIDLAWDRNDFRAIRDLFTAEPGNIPELVARCRSYLAVHPGGRFTTAASELLRWSERVTAPGEYRVILHNGAFETAIARWLSRGPDLSVEIEVAGVRYGPSPIVKNRYDPVWEYEFPRRIRWKLGDPVVVRVTDHDWLNRVVVTIASPEGDPLAMRFLSGEIASGINLLNIESDFALPVLPAVED